MSGGEQQMLAMGRALGIADRGYVMESGLITMSGVGWDGEVLVLNVLGKPSASKDAIGKPKGTQLKISVTAAPKDGRATDYMLRFLAPLFGVAVADIEVVFGQENVNKQLRIRAPKKLPAVFTDAAASGD